MSSRKALLKILLLMELKKIALSFLRLNFIANLIQRMSLRAHEIIEPLNIETGR